MNNIREESFLGSQKLIVGNPNEELVLESLGRIFLKHGKSTTVLNEIIDKVNELTSEDSTTEDAVGASVVIVDSTDDLDSSLDDGTLAFVTSTNSLYIKIDGTYELLILAAALIQTVVGDYVKKAGDTMTGLLSITLSSDPPLKVVSSALVENLNADLLDGEHSTAFARKEWDENITGNWSHSGTTTFNNTVLVNNNIRQPAGGIYTNGYIGTPVFTSGFTGEGWSLLNDTSGYTLTVDNLVVRKTMLVYEMIVNKINATNGSMWVSDYAKVSSANLISIVTEDNPVFVNTQWFVKYTEAELNKSYYIVEVGSEHLATSLNCDYIQTDSGTYESKEKIKYIIFTKLYYATHMLGDTALVGENEDSLTASSEVKVFNLFENLEYFIGIENDLEDNNISEDLIKAKFKIVPANIVDSSGNLVINVTQKDSNYVYKTDVDVWSYFKYFGVRYDLMFTEKRNKTDTDPYIYVREYVPNLYMVEFESEDAIPTLWEGDIIRCQKFYEHGIKYYDGLIGLAVGSVKSLELAEEEESEEITETTTEETDEEDVKNYYLPVLLGVGSTLSSITVNYDDETHAVSNEVDYIYHNTENLDAEMENSMELIPISEGDLMVRMGSLTNKDRLGAIYLTSSESYSPYMDTIANVNRPDYSTVYYTPKYKTFKALYTIGTVTKYRTFYLQNDEFAVEYAKGSGDIYDTYHTETIDRTAATSATTNLTESIETNNTTFVTLTNDIVETTIYDTSGIPIFIEYPINDSTRKLYVDNDTSTYITVESFNNSTDSVNGTDNCVYHLGTI